MINKVNIFEELNKMKSLIHTKSGVVISEQNIATDIDTIVKNIASLSLSSENEKAVVNTIINNSKTKQDFENLLSQFKSKTGKDLSTELPKVLQPGRDDNEISQLKTHLSGIGITMEPKYTNNRWVGFSFTGLGGVTQSQTTGAVTERQKGITSRYCSVKNGMYTINGKVHDWNAYSSSLKVTEEEIAEAKKTCPGVVVGKTVTGPTPTQRFATTATSLGIQNPKMDVATLQTILNTLNQGGSGLTESKNIVKEELNKMKYMLGYQRGRVISEQPAPAAAPVPAPATPKDLITLIQTVLNDKFKQPLGPTGADGRWGKFSQDALENALKTVGDVSQKRASETQQTSSQDSSIQQAAEKGRMEIPQTNNLPKTPGVQSPTIDIYTTLVNNKTLQTRDNGNKIVYKGADLPIAQRQELESKLQGMGYRVSRENNDIKQGDKIVFKKN